MCPISNVQSGLKPPLSRRNAVSYVRNLILSAVCRHAGGADIEIRRAINDNKPLSGSQAKK
ncbi:hypothetical protein F3I27_04615 [Pantoea sp. Bo_2]|nr:hypothetical protein F3I56_03070 [Pantoea sp. VH_25]KAA6003900.1 hypothetical protein F3I45_06715 [Pantoea sp. F_7]KAA6012113.1 hypothetical protein F3I43_06710 [Pantoea sp. F_18]KAA6014656.1 hypothetical protein F3I44_06710 [Pantoea sp. F_5]KAA6017330.1 hypothetical protein F3I40_06710 [Pantoea sp. F_15]KAA6024982.1 hypothetical protein F3I42_06710 [Pantoea sp. F_17]KAA6027277.1 hypothetical protein F3I38_06715 [Pantoea sp. F_12]KAA6033422.1 hypothetical protein F3I41_06715 [Pantoea sp. 